MASGSLAFQGSKSLGISIKDLENGEGSPHSLEMIIPFASITTEQRDTCRSRPFVLGAMQDRRFSERIGSNSKSHSFRLSPSTVSPSFGVLQDTTAKDTGNQISFNNKPSDARTCFSEGPV